MEVDGLLCSSCLHVFSTVQTYAKGCVCVCRCVWTIWTDVCTMCMPVCAHGSQRSTSGITYHSVTSSFKLGFLTEPRYSWVLARLTDPGDPVVTAYPPLPHNYGYRQTEPFLVFYVCAGTLNSGLHACTVSALAHQTISLSYNGSGLFYH